MSTAPSPTVGETETAERWSAVAAGALALLAVFGVHYSFGSFFPAITDEYNTARGTTAVIFSATTLLYFMVGIVTGRLVDRIGARPLLLTAAVTIAGGLVAATYVNSFPVLVAVYSIGVGTAIACTYVPMLAIVGASLDRHRTIGLGIAVAGIGIGTLLAGPTADALIERSDWRSAYRTLAIAAAVLLITAAAIAGPTPTTRTGTPTNGRPTLRTSRPYRALYSANLAVSAVIFVPFVFLGDYLDTTNTDIGAGLLIGLIGLSSVVGRIALGALRYSPLVLYRACFAGITLSFGLWILHDTHPATLIVFAVALGVAYGGFIALAPAVAAHFFGTEQLGTTLGYLYTSAGIGGFAGPIGFGALADTTTFTSALVATVAVGTIATALLWTTHPAPAAPSPC